MKKKTLRSIAEETSPLNCIVIWSVNILETLLQVGDSFTSSLALIKLGRGWSIIPSVVVQIHSEVNWGRPLFSKRTMLLIQIEFYWSRRWWRISGRREIATASNSGNWIIPICRLRLLVCSVLIESIQFHWEGILSWGGEVVLQKERIVSWVDKGIWVGS